MFNSSRIRFFFFIGLCLITAGRTTSKAQELKHNSLTAGIGLQFTGIRDLVYSPLLYTGTEALLSLGYRRSGDSFYHGIDFFFSSGYYEAETGSQLNAQSVGLEFGYSHIIFSASENQLKLFLGGTGDISFLMRTYQLVPSIRSSTEEKPSPEIYSSANIKLSGIFHPDPKNSFSGQIWFPVISYYVRSEYTTHAADRIEVSRDATFGDVIRAGRAAGPEDYFHIGAAFSYERRLSDYFSLKTECSFFFGHVNEPLKKDMLNNGLNLKIAYLF
ncbi:MAG: hypothetical protein ACM3Q2_00510 [Syntrophothermus sp.]